MSTLTNRRSEAPDATKILSEGAFFILPRCAAHDEIYPRVHDAFFAAVREIEGEACESAIRRDGLAKLHLHFPTEKVLLLEEHVRRTLKELLLYWSYRVGHDDLKLPDPFYVDHLIVIRVHFPFEVARTAKSAIVPPGQRADLVDHGVSALRNPRIILNQAARALRRTKKNAAFNPTKFHGLLPKPAQSHGAHIDTWYGHSFDGINLWWSIEGVTVDNTVILYPEMFARPVSYDEESMYLAAGQQISAPHQVDLKPGELLLFNPETLHATQLNISQNTRVALTTRINPKRPTFNDEAPFNFEHWHESRDLVEKRFKALKVFPAAKNQGRPAYQAKPKLERRQSKTLSYARPFAPGPVCPAADLPAHLKLAVDFDDLKLMLWRDGSGAIKAYSRLCPHVGVDLIDGWHDEKAAHCPGHGLSFDWSDGRSKCTSFKLVPFAANEKDGWICIERGAARKNQADEIAR